MSESYYTILDVPSTASVDEIRKAHRTLCRHYHPDTAPDGVGDPVKFAQVQEAYEVLSSPAGRRRYDRVQAQVRAREAAYARNAAKRRSPRPEHEPAPNRRPQKVPCAACNSPVYASQLTLYLGRLICQECHSQRKVKKGRFVAEQF